MRFCFLDTIGLSYDGSTLEKKGLGGSESAVIYMSRYLSELGIDVTVFCKCEEEGVYHGVTYKNLDKVNGNTEEFDVIISSRNCVPFIPEHLAPEVIQVMGFDPSDYKDLVSRSNYKIVWMHDLFCVGDLWLETLLVEGYVNELFTLTDWHSHYVSSTTPEYENIKLEPRRYDVLKDKIYQTRNGVFNHLGEIDISKKDRNKFIYNASISKGMEPLLERIWPKVKERIPAAKLIIIGGYYRFPWNDGPDEFEKKWMEFRDKYNGRYGIHFTGVISQKQIAEELADASFFIYPNTYKETFGISTLEAIQYNVPVITVDNGALEEVADNSVCYKMPYNIDLVERQLDKFVDLVVEAYHDGRRWEQKAYRCNAFKEWIGWDKIAYLWKQHIYRKMGFFNFVEHEKKAREIQSNLLRLFNRRHINQEDKYLDYSLDEKKRKIIFLSPVYNAESTIEIYIHSIAAQLYQNYEVYLVDDCSTDETVRRYEDVLKGFPGYVQEKFHLIRNRQRVGSALGNQVETLGKLLEKESGDDTIIALLDGDDWLYNNPDICSLINHEYEKGAKVTYGSFYSLIDDINLIAQPYPKEVHKERSYRKYRFPWNVPYTHLRTFLLSEFNKVSIDSLKGKDGNYYKAGGDIALLYELFEKVDNPEESIRPIYDILYVYNDRNPLCDFKVNSEEQTMNAEDILHKDKSISHKAREKDKASIEVVKKRNKVRILVAVPTAKYIESETFKSIYNLEKKDNWVVDVQFFYGYRVDQVRNLIADYTIKEDYDYVLNVDSDMILPSNALINLMNRDKGVVSGVYLKKELDKKIPEMYGGEVVDENGQTDYNWLIKQNGNIVTIYTCGFGCVLIKKEVFQKIGYPWFEYHVSYEFKDSISEDTDFCLKAMNKGYNIYLDTGVFCEHIGSFSVKL